MGEILLLALAMERQRNVGLGPQTLTSITKGVKLLSVQSCLGNVIKELETRTPRRRSQRKRQSGGKPVAAKMQQQFKTMQKDVALMFIPRTLQQELGCNPSALKLHGYRNCALDFACR